MNYSQPDIKSLQIQLTGFLDKDTATFCKDLWKLLLSAQESPQGVPKELLEAKKLELIQEKARAHRYYDVPMIQSDWFRYRSKPTRPPRRLVSGTKNSSAETAGEEDSAAVDLTHGAADDVTIETETMIIAAEGVSAVAGADPVPHPGSATSAIVVHPAGAAGIATFRAEARHRDAGRAMRTDSATIDGEDPSLGPDLSTRLPRDLALEVQAWLAGDR